MKRIIYYLAFCLLLFAMQASGQVTTIDISTGVNSTGNLIGLNQPDDDWDICYDGVYVNYPTNYQPATPTYADAYCGSGIIGPPAPALAYGAGLASSARWICGSTNINSSGQHTGASQGQYYYKRSFPGMHCVLDSAILELDTIIADNFISHITVNGCLILGIPNNNNTLAYQYESAPHTGIRIWIPTSCLNPNGAPNTLVVHVVQNTVVMGMQIKGQIKLYGTVPDASFCASNNGNIFTATSSQSGYHNWEVQGSMTGQYGTFVPLITLYQQSISLPSYGYSCLRFKHKVTNECGFSSCESQSVCRYDCETGTGPSPCELSSITNATFVNSLFSWNPVPGATSYIVEILPNTRECCAIIPLDGPTAPIDIPTTFTSASWRLWSSNIACIRWRIKALCPNGSYVVSEWKCHDFSELSKRGPDQPKAGNKALPAQALVKLFPNPAKGAVTIDIETASDLTYTISVFDITGKLIKTLEPGKTENKKATVKWNTEQLSKGTYLVKITTSDSKTITQKLLIE